MFDRLNYRYTGRGIVLLFRANSQYVVTAYTNVEDLSIDIWAASYNASTNPRINIATWWSLDYGNGAI